MAAMTRRFIGRILAATLVAFALPASLFAADEDTGSAPANLTLEQILERNAVARGGVAAWRKIDTMAWTGHIETSGGPAAGLPFMVELQRPNKTHFELINGAQKSLRIFDGSQGWRMRPAAGGPPEVKTYNADELNYSSDEQVIDGLLLDHQAKGHIVTFQAVDKIDGKPAYRLGVVLRSGALARLWLNANTFLEMRLEREASRGAAAGVAIDYREYRDFEGLQIATVIETLRAAGQVDRLLIERLALNPQLGDASFARPGQKAKRGKIIVDTRSAARPGP
jgi:hypothetical protein